MLGGSTSRRLTRIGLAAVAAASVVVLAAPSAYAADGRIEQAVPQPDGHLSVVFSASGLATTESIDPASVTVTVGGQSVPATATRVGSSTARTTLLVMDVSASMKATTSDGTVRLTAAKSAAGAYLDSVPADIRVGLVTFGDSARVAVAPTTDRAAVRRALATLTAAGGTSLFDAVILAGSTLGTEGVRNQLVLSDGVDDGSTATLAQATAAVTRAAVTLDAVSLGSDSSQVADITALTEAGGGSVVATNQADDLAKAFASAAQSQATQVVVDVTVPPNVAGTSQNVTVTATAGAQTVGDSASVILPAAATGVPAGTVASDGPKPVPAYEPGITSRPWFLGVAILGVGLGLFGLLAVALLATDPDARQEGRIRRRLSRYSLVSRPETTASTVPTSGALGQSQVARSAVELAGRMVQRRDLDTGLGTKLEAAGVPLRPAEWMLVHVGIAIVTALVFTLLSAFNVGAAILGLVLGVGLPWAYLAVKEDKRKARFATQLPDTLQLLAGSLAAGYSLPQAVDTVVRESDGPMAVELNRSLVEARLGVPMEDALETTARRMDSVDFAWVVMAIRIQREVGGNLAEVLTNVAATMRERERLRRQVQVLSAEGRLSAVILGALPIVFMVYLILVRPEYVSLLITTPIGIVLVVVGLVLMVGGSLWLRKVVKVEV